MKKNLKKGRTGARPPARKGPVEAAAPLSPGRKWLFRVLAMVVLPLILLGGLELALRLAGYGHATGLFTTIRSGGREYLVDNDDFSLRFFPPQLARWPGPVMFEKQKPAGTYRIFVLGESAARGEPEPNFAASRYLEALLDARYPGTHFEVINLGITAIDSHVILPMARDCAKAGGDLWIIYMGNNEMVGPFGAATVFGQKAPPLPVARLNLALQQTRLGQLLLDTGRRLKKADANASWGGMKMFLGNQLRDEDPRKAVVYQNFARNLDDIVEAGLGSGVKIMLNTMAVNLKDCPPFASMLNSNLPAGAFAEFNRFYAAGCAAQAQTNYAAAADDFARAEKLDWRYPDLQYHWGQCLLALHDPGAEHHLQLACDVDALPFRADSRINAVIQTAGLKYARNGLVCFDAAAALAEEAPDHLCGAETFFEHVHFTFDGNFRLGRAWADQVAKMLPAEIARGAATNGWISRAACEERLGLTDWNRCAVTDMMVDRLHRPPLSGQANNAERIAALRSAAADLRQRMTPAAAQVADAAYQAAIAQRPQDWLLHQNFAEFLEINGHLKEAAEQWRQMQELLPHSCEPYYQSGRVLAELQQWDAAEPVLEQAIALRPRFAEAWFELGGVHLSKEAYQAALDDYERARQLAPDDATYCAYTGKALGKLGRHAEAIQRYQAAIRLDPDIWEAHFALGDELSNGQEFSQAADEYAEVIRLRPNLPLAHLDRGVVLARAGQYDGALQEFQATLGLDPGNQQAREYMERVREWQERRR